MQDDHELYSDLIHLTESTSITRRSNHLEPNRIRSTKLIYQRRQTRVYTVDYDEAMAVQGSERGQIIIKRVVEPVLPTNIVGEVEILSSLNHPNIISLINAYSLPLTMTYYLYEPFYPITLTSLMASPLFVPNLPLILSSSSPTATTPFSIVVHSLSWQIIETIRYLHSVGVSHRDISVENYMISRRGRIVLIDFELAVRENSEPPGRMWFEVGTGPYRAPELLFGARSYSPPALDLWSLGVVLASFFTPLQTAPCASSSSRGRSLDSLISVSLAGTQEREDEEMKELESEFNNVDMTGEKKIDLKRLSLFKSEYGDFALMGSIFRIIGTPTIETWPEAIDLRDFTRFPFQPFPATRISSHLPYLPPCSPLESIITGLLRCSAQARMTAQEALSGEAWQEVVVFLPSDMDEVPVQVWNGMELGELVGMFLSERNEI